MAAIPRLAMRTAAFMRLTVAHYNGRPVKRFASVWLVLIAATLHVRGQWPEFRGPTGQGHSSDTNLPLEWSETRNVRWKTPIPGRGWSSPVVADGRIWLTTAVESDGISLRTLAFDLESGRQVVDVE